jgi:protein tyrosine phosphatase (PTP) superfamily phosphohydrolase (DUF442 family)
MPSMDGVRRESESFLKMHWDKAKLGREIEMFRKPLLIVSLCFLQNVAFAGTDPKLPEGVHVFKQEIFLSGAPHEDTFREMANAGVRIAVDLREPEEIQGFEKSAAKRNEITYYSTSISRVGDLQKDQIEAVDRIVAQRQGQKIWVYCNSANRAASWMAIHLAKTQGMKADDAIAEAKNLGLNKEEMVTKVRAFLQKK